MIRTALRIALLPALLAVVATAQNAPADAVSSKPHEPFVVPAGETSIKDLVDSCATYLNVNILSNPQECSMTSPIRLQKAITTNRDGCQDVLTGLLYRAGFALTTVDENLGMYEIIMMTGTRGREVMSRAQQKTNAEILAHPNLKVPVTTVVQLKHINAQIANNSLRPFFASTGGSHSALSFGSVGSQSALIITGMQDQVAQAIEMLTMCDVAPAPQAAPQAGANKSSDERINELEARVISLERQLAKLTKKSGEK